MGLKHIEAGGIGVPIRDGYRATLNTGKAIGVLARISGHLGHFMARLAGYGTGLDSTYGGLLSQAVMLYNRIGKYRKSATCRLAHPGRGLDGKYIISTFTTWTQDLKKLYGHTETVRRF